MKKEMASRKLKIGSIDIDPENRPFVIPEIGINHEDSLPVAKEMALSARRAGLRLIRHQMHMVEDEMSRTACKAIPGNSAVFI